MNNLSKFCQTCGRPMINRGQSNEYSFDSSTGERYLRDEFMEWGCSSPWYRWWPFTDHSGLIYRKFKDEWVRSGRIEL